MICGEHIVAVRVDRSTTGTTFVDVRARLRAKFAGESTQLAERSALAYKPAVVARVKKLLK